MILSNEYSKLIAENTMPMNKKIAKAESAVLDAVIHVCEGYPSSLGRNSDGEFLMACAEMLSVLTEKKRAL